jgi:hypothetical protein
MAKSASGGAGGKKTEVVTVRFDPKLKYLAEIAARKQRRPLSNFIEWAVEHSLEQVMLTEPRRGTDISVASAERAYRLWNIEDADRLVRLAFHHPELLTLEEEKLWKLIRENGFLWRGDFLGQPPQWTWDVQERSIRWERLRECWPIFTAVAQGSKPIDDLPKWEKFNRALSRHLRKT